MPDHAHILRNFMLPDDKLLSGSNIAVRQQYHFEQPLRKGLVQTNNSAQPRHQKAMRNAIFGLVSYIVLMAANFITRKVLVIQLGMGLAGVENLFKSGVSMLALAELGIGTGLAYLLYKPIAENDRKAIRRILNFYRYAYRIIAAIIFILGIGASFAINLFVEDTYNPVFISITFILFLLDTLAAYLFAEQRALIIADQKNYLNNLNEIILYFTTMVLQIALLFVIKSFVVYAVVKVVCRVFAALLIHRNFVRLYPDIASDPDRTRLDKQTTSGIMKNIRAMLCHKIGSLGVSSSGSMIISALLGTVVNGIYGNYTLITMTLNSLVGQMFSGVTASFGDFSWSTGDVRQSLDKFNILHYLNFLIVSFCTTSFFVISQPFVTLWMGKEGLLETHTVALLAAFFFVYTMRKVIFVVRDSVGLYHPDRFMPLLELAVNVGLGITLCIAGLGIDGVLIGSIVSMLVVPFWIQPIIIYKHVFKCSPMGYFTRYAAFAGLTAVGCTVTSLLANAVCPDNIWLSLLVRAGLCIILPNVINILPFIRTPEFRYTANLAGGMIRRFIPGKK